MISMNHGVIAYQICEGGVDSACIENFLDKSMTIYRKYYEDEVTIVMDNAGCHRNKNWFFDLEYYHNNFLFTSPYSFEYQPIEEFFGNI